MYEIGKILIGSLTAGLMFAAAAQAAPQDVKSEPELLAYCPALVAGSGCPEAVAAFVEATNPNGDQIFELVLRISADADLPTVPHEVCLDAADGLRVFAGVPSAAEREQEITEIANGICNRSSADTGKEGLGGAAGSGGVGQAGGNGTGADGDDCAGNSTQKNGQNCDNPNNSDQQNGNPPSSTDDCAGNSTQKNGQNCDNPNNSDQQNSGQTPG